MVIHVRCASREDQKGLEYVHPIEIEEDGNKYYFFHNGYAPDVHSALRGRLTLLPASTVAANCLCFGPEGITVANWFSQDIGYPQYYTMHFLQGTDVKIIASEQIRYHDGIDAWRPLGNGTIIQIPHARI